MDIGKRIKARRKELGMTVDEIAEKLGKNRATIYRYESGDINEMSYGVLGPLAKILKTTPAELAGWGTDIIGNAKEETKKNIRMVNIYGRVAAGQPIEAIEEYLDTVPFSVSSNETEQYYGLKIDGDSMEPNILYGDYVIVRKQDYAEDGDIIIALVDGKDATCKQLRKHQNGISLVSLNPKYAPMFFTAKEVRETPVRIIGKVVELRRSI